MSKFTQGKWKSKAFTIVDEHSIAIARISNVGWKSDTVQANARLIEAAPEMYEKLKTAINYCDYAEEFSPAAKIVARNIQELLARIDGEQEAE